MKIIVPTKGRSDVIGKKALRLFPDATLCVGADEVDAYAALSDNLLVHPPEVVGIGPLRQWVLDHVDDPCVVMADDDVTHGCSAPTHFARRVSRPAALRGVAIIAPGPLHI